MIIYSLRKGKKKGYSEYVVRKNGFTCRFVTLGGKWFIDKW